MSDDTEDLGVRVQAATRTALADIISSIEGGLVLKWVAIVESCNAQGERGVWTMTSEDVKTWDTLGLLEYGLDLQRAQIVNATNERLGRCGTWKYKALTRHPRPGPRRLPHLLPAIPRLHHHGNRG